MQNVNMIKDKNQRPVLFFFVFFKFACKLVSKGIFKNKIVWLQYFGAISHKNKKLVNVRNRAKSCELREQNTQGEK